MFSCVLTCSGWDGGVGGVRSDTSASCFNKQIEWSEMGSEVAGDGLADKIGLLFFSLNMKSCHVMKNFFFSRSLSFVVVTENVNSICASPNISQSIDECDFDCVSFITHLLLNDNSFLHLFPSPPPSKQSSERLSSSVWRFLGSTNFSRKSFVFQEIIQHTRTTTRDFQLLLNFSTHPTLCFENMQTDASRSLVARLPLGIRLAEVSS